MDQLWNRGKPERGLSETQVERKLKVTIGTRMGRNEANEVITMGSPVQEDKPLYPRRHPRVGSQFQTKVPKLYRTSQRPLPQLMSKDFPHVKACDIPVDNFISEGRSWNKICEVPKFTTEKLVKNLDIRRFRNAYDFEIAAKCDRFVLFDD